jgi:hypothetical protein
MAANLSARCIGEQRVCDFPLSLHVSLVWVILVKILNESDTKKRHGKPKPKSVTEK